MRHALLALIPAALAAGIASAVPRVPGDLPVRMAGDRPILVAPRVVGPAPDGPEPETCRAACPERTVGTRPATPFRPAVVTPRTVEGRPVLRTLAVDPGAGDVPFAVRLAPGASLVVDVIAGAEGATLSVAGDGGLLTPAALAATARAPAWARVDLVANLALLPADRQDALAAPLRDDALAAWHDEVAFLLGSLPAASLADPEFDVRAVVDQARFVARAAEGLDYVDLVHVSADESDDGPYTTAEYAWREGGRDRRARIPRDAYYWWVLHPVLDLEPFADIDPTTGRPGTYPAATTWRQYYLHAYPWPPEGTGPASYVPHFVFKEPPPREALPGFPAIAPGSLAGWGPVQRGWLREIAVGALRLTVDARDRPTTIEFKVKPTGIVLATTLEVERAWAEERSPLLENLLRYGPGNVGLHPWTGKVLVVQERDPVPGHPGLIEGALAGRGYEFDVVDAAWLADGDLSPYVKVLVPSDQPKTVYQALADAAPRLLEWLRGNWRILQVHGAVTDASRDWSGIELPGGFTGDAVAQPSLEGGDLARVLGQPFLDPEAAGNPDTPRAIPYLWVDELPDHLPGERFVEDTECAIDRVSWWAAQNMFDSVGDWSWKHPGIATERTSQANRVLYQHYGNCGELQDIVTAASRTLLIPSVNTSNGAEDHVWSEFLLADGDWHPIGLDWSDGYARVDDFGVSFSKKFGGGKNISLVTAYRGDGRLLNRTPSYADTGVLTVRVVDDRDDPIRGALVLVATESWVLDGDAYPLMLAFWDVTGDDGNVAIDLGVNVHDDPATECQDLGNRCNNYYIRVITAAGTWPPEAGRVALAVAAAEAFAGFEKTVTATIAGHLDVPGPEGDLPVWTPDPRRPFGLTLDAVTRLRCGDLGDGGSWCDPAGPGTARFAVLDAAESALRDGGLPYRAAAAGPAAGGFAFSPEGGPVDGEWRLVVEHPGPLQDPLLITGVLTMAGPPPPPDDAVEPAPDAVADAAGADLSGKDDATARDASDTGAPNDPGDGGRASGGCAAGGPSPAGVPPPWALLAVLALAFVLAGSGSSRR